MLFAVDIDRTIGIDKDAIARDIARRLRLAVEENIFATLEDFWQFCALPEVVRYRQASRINEERFQNACVQAKASLQVLAGLYPLPGAADGLRILMQYGQVAFYTSRSVEMQDTTRSWLARHNFPTGLEIVSCKNFYVKYVASYDATKATNEPVMLIDDNAQKLIAAWPRTVEKWPHVAEYSARFTLVAFGVPLSDLSIDVPFPVLSLQSWGLEHIQALLDRGLVSQQQEETSYGER